MFSRKHIPARAALALLLVLAARAWADDTSSPKLSLDYSQLSLEDLMNIQVTTVTLTSTDRRLTPASVTYIDRSMIDQANPRSLNDLLNVYVPNLETAYHTFEARHLGLRGIIGDRDDKYLMLVNGRMMNERTHYGALTERDMILMGDLNEVDMVRGPGSATYGPGAVIGVLSLTTLNGFTFQGNEVSFKQGFLDEYTTLEYKFGKQFTGDTAFFFYAGVADVHGSSIGNSPIVQGYDWNSPKFGQVRAGEPVPYPLDNMGDAYNDRPQIKIHAQLDTGGFTAWVRYSNGGEMLDQTDKTYAPGHWGNPNGWLPPFRAGVGYEQLTAFLGYKKDLTKDLTLDVNTSWDATDYERYFLFGPANSHQEQKLISQAVLNWTGLQSHKMALGLEYGYYWLGNHSWMSPSLDIQGDNTNPWETSMASLFFEDQWNIIKDWTLFTSFRVDKHSYTDYMFSPRLALVWTPTEKDTLKGIASQSLRTNTEEGMHADWLNGKKKSMPEKVNTLEVRYERQQTKDLLFATSLFFNDLDVLGWNDTLQEVTNVGSYKTAGIELEAQYRTENDIFTFSHGYSKLVGEDLHTTNFITSAGFGYGYDINSWSNNVTKLSAHHQFDQHLSIDGNIQVDWGYPGGKSYLLWHNSQAQMHQGLPDATDPQSWNKPYGIAASLNLGLEYKFNAHATLRFDAYNVLGWANKTLDKTMVLGSLYEGAYRDQTPSFAVSFKYKF